MKRKSDEGNSSSMRNVRFRNLNLKNDDERTNSLKICDEYFESNKKSKNNSSQSINSLQFQEARNLEDRPKKQVSVLIRNQNRVLKNQINTKHFKQIQLRRNNLNLNKICRLYQHFQTSLLRKLQNRDNIQPKVQN